MVVAWVCAAGISRLLLLMLATGVVCNAVDLLAMVTVAAAVSGKIESSINHVLTQVELHVQMVAGITGA